MRCPECGKEMHYFSGLESIPEGLYCLVCNDAIYDEEGVVLCLLQ